MSNRSPFNENDICSVSEYWEKQAKSDPLWAILSDPAKKGRKWNPKDFFETGQREISILMFRLKSLKIDVSRTKALDFGCGIGRLTQALAGHFERVTGVDVSETMIRLANRFNRFPDRVAYVANQSEHLRILEDADFDFVYSNIVLQHLQPALTLGYLEEFRRILRPGGLLIFQLPSHRLKDEAVRPAAAVMADDAYSSSLRLVEFPPSPQKPSAQLSLWVFVKNAGRGEWVRDEAAPIRLGNHWLSGDGKSMLIQDDGRADLPRVLEAGEKCLVELKVKTPPEEGDYQCEIDLVHEGIYWFKEKGAATVRFGLRVVSEAGDEVTQAAALPSPVAAPASASGPALKHNAPHPSGVRLPENPDDIYRELPAQAEDPGDFPMHGIPRAQVIDFFQSRGDVVIRVEEDEHGGREWVGYQYYVSRKAF